MRLLSSALALSLLAAVPGAAQDDVEGPVIDHRPLKVTVSGKPVVIEAKIADDNGVFEPAVLYRVGGEGAFLSLPMEATGEADVYAATIPGDIVVARLEYFIEAFDELGNGPTREGDPDLPMTVQVVAPSVAPAPAQPPDTVKDPDAGKAAPASDAGASEAEEQAGSVGMWIGIGGAAAGGVAAVAALAVAGAATAYFLVFQDGGNTTPSQVTVTVSSPSPTGAALTAGAP